MSSTVSIIHEFIGGVNYLHLYTLKIQFDEAIYIIDGFQLACELEDYLARLRPALPVLSLQYATAYRELHGLYMCADCLAVHNARLNGDLYVTDVLITTDEEIEARQNRDDDLCHSPLLINEFSIKTSRRRPLDQNQLSELEVYVKNYANNFISKLP